MYGVERGKGGDYFKALPIAIDLGGMWKDAAKRDTKNERWKAGTG